MIRETKESIVFFIILISIVTIGILFCLLMTNNCNNTQSQVTVDSISVLSLNYNPVTDTNCLAWYESKNYKDGKWTATKGNDLYAYTTISLNDLQTWIKHYWNDSIIHDRTYEGYDIYEKYYTDSTMKREIDTNYVTAHAFENGRWINDKIPRFYYTKHKNPNDIEGFINWMENKIKKERKESEKTKVKEHKSKWPISFNMDGTKNYLESAIKKNH